MRLERIEHAVDTIAIEVERISEGQRFVTQADGGRPSSAADESSGAADGASTEPLMLGAGAMEPIVVAERETRAAEGCHAALRDQKGSDSESDTRVHRIPGLRVGRRRTGGTARRRGTRARHAAGELGRVAGRVRDQTSDFRLHEYNADFYILRQSGCTNYEKPFLYLIFGDGQALLVDTGAKGARVADAIAAALKRWADAHGKPIPRLIAAHSHAHGDHVAGDSALGAMAGVTVVGTSPEAVRRFFGIKHGPIRRRRSTSADACSTSFRFPDTSARRSPSTTGGPASC